MHDFASRQEWQCGGVPITSLCVIERRKGKASLQIRMKQDKQIPFCEHKQDQTRHHIALVSTNETPIYSADDNQESQGRSHQDFRQMYSIWSLLVFFANVSRLNSRKFTNILLPLLELFVVFMLSMPLLHYLVLLVTTSCGLISL